MPSPAASWAGGRNTAQARGDAQQPILARAGPQALASSTLAAGLGLQIEFSCKWSSTKAAAEFLRAPEGFLIFFFGGVCFNHLMVVFNLV